MDLSDPEDRMFRQVLVVRADQLDPLLRLNPVQRLLQVVRLLQ